MSVIVTDAGFISCQDDDRFLDIASDDDLTILADQLDRARLIRIDFPSFADGRGFTLARQLRLMGFKGRLRAKGHVIAEQYAMARRSGFDEVEISDALAIRQPEDQWLSRANWTDHDYQQQLRGSLLSGNAP